MPKLRIEHSNRPATELELEEGRITVGRGVDNTLHFRDPWLSREHAFFLAVDGGYAIDDLGSRNGTYLNGERIERRRRLSDGDVVTLGDVRLTYMDESGTALRLAESEIPLTGRGTVIIPSEELRYDRISTARSESPALVDSLLPALNEVTSALIHHYPLDELVEKVLAMVLEAVPAERGVLLLRPRRDATRRGAVPLGIPGEDGASADDGAADSEPDASALGELPPLEVVARRGYDARDEVRISRTIIRAVLDDGQAVLTLDAQSDERFDRAVSIMIQGIRSILCAPLVNNDREVIGMIYLDHRVGGDVFSELTLRLVGLIANLAAVKVENCYLLEDQLEKRRMEEELAVGAKIQRALLPAEDPEIEGWDICGVNQSCFEIGGDYYDYIREQDGKLALVVADISGKGVGAALLMAVLQASLRTLIKTVAGPAELVCQLNEVLVENSPDNKFATLFYAELDLEQNRLEYVSGGHNPAYLLGPEGLVELGSSGPIVGLISGAEFRSRVVEMPPGAVLLIYTDGVTELENDELVQFGVEPVEKAIEELGDGSASDLVETIHGTMRQFAGGEQFDDDATLLVVKRAEPATKGTLEMPLEVEAQGPPSR